MALEDIARLFHVIVAASPYVVLAVYFLELMYLLSAVGRTKPELYYFMLVILQYYFLTKTLTILIDTKKTDIGGIRK